MFVFALDNMAKRVAVILSGCGVYDGTEVHEASAVMVHLSRASAKVTSIHKTGLCAVHFCFKKNFSIPIERMQMSLSNAV